MAVDALSHVEGLDDLSKQVCFLRELTCFIWLVACLLIYELFNGSVSFW